MQCMIVVWIDKKLISFDSLTSRIQRCRAPPWQVTKQRVFRIEYNLTALKYIFKNKTIVAIIAINNFLFYSNLKQFLWRKRKYVVQSKT